MLYFLKWTNLLKSIGNDIVDLRSVDKSRTEEPRYYSKILSAGERELYHSSQLSQLPFFIFVWVLWSVKESGYKYLKRNFPDLVFSPTKIIVKNIICPNNAQLPGSLIWNNTDSKDEFYSGHAVYGNINFYFRSKINSNWLTSAVNDSEDFENVYWGMKTIDSTEYAIQSQESKLLLLEKLSAFLQGDLKIEKRGTPYPSVFRDNENLNIPVSLSHDGNFIAYAFIANWSQGSKKGFWFRKTFGPFKKPNLNLSGKLIKKFTSNFAM